MPRVGDGVANHQKLDLGGAILEFGQLLFVSRTPPFHGPLSRLHLRGQGLDLYRGLGGHGHRGTERQGHNTTHHITRRHFIVDPFEQEPDPARQSKARA